MERLGTRLGCKLVYTGVLSSGRVRARLALDGGGVERWVHDEGLINALFQVQTCNEPCWIATHLALEPPPSKVLLACRRFLDCTQHLYSSCCAGQGDMQLIKFLIHCISPRYTAFSM